MFDKISAMLLLLVGIHFTSVGFRWINPSKSTADPHKVEEWHRRYGLLMRIGGPLLIVGSLVWLSVSFKLL